MSDPGSTSIRLTPDLHEWISQQARVRDVSRSQLLRSLICEARAAIAATEGMGGPVGWPPMVAPPLHTRLPGRHQRDPKTGRFMS